MIDALIPLIFGLLFYLKPEIFIKKDSQNFEAKRAKFVTIGKVLLGITVLLFLGSTLTRIGAPNNNAIISGSDRDRFVRIFANSCKQEILNNPDALDISENAIDEYCYCSANGVANQTTYKELKSDTANMEQKMNAVTSCSEILQNAI